MWVELQHSFFSPILSGQDRKIHVLCDELLRRGFQVSICTSHDGVDKISSYEAKGLRFILHPPFVSRKPKSLLDPILYVGKLQDFLQARSESGVPDLILAFHHAYVVSSKHAWPHATVAFLAGATVSDWHSWLHGHRSAAARSVLFAKLLLSIWMERQATVLADRIFLESQLLNEEFLRFHRNVQGKVVLCPAPVDTSRFHSSSLARRALRRSLLIPDKVKAILAVGRLHWNKNFLTLIRAVSLLKRSDWLLLIVGNGPEEELLKEAVELAGIGDRVRFVESHTEIEQIYAAADIFAHPALLEPYGYVVLEAMSSGLPCVVSPGANVGVSGNLIEGVDVLFADPRDPQDWANKIERLLNDPWLSARLGKEARKFCEGMPGWPSLTSRLLQECGLAPFERSAQPLAASLKTAIR